MILVGDWHKWIAYSLIHKMHGNQQKNYAYLQIIIIIFSSEFF